MNKIAFSIFCFMLISACVWGSPENERRLDRTIDHVLQQDQYQWRLPRGKFEPPKDSFLSSVFYRLNRYFLNFIDTVRKWMSEFRKWLNKRLPSENSPGEQSRFSGKEKFLLYALAAVAAALLIVLFFKMRKQKKVGMVNARAVSATPDLANEEVIASQLPENEWLEIAQQLEARGDLRLAMRALYMSCLVYLASQSLITIAKFKSNREYQFELQRRAHSYPQLLKSFFENVSLLERSWYGNHPVSPEAYEKFAKNQQELRI